MAPLQRHLLCSREGLGVEHLYWCDVLQLSPWHSVTVSLWVQVGRARSPRRGRGPADVPVLPVCCRDRLLLGPHLWYTHIAERLLLCHFVTVSLCHCGCKSAGQGTLDGGRGRADVPVLPVGLPALLAAGDCVAVSLCHCVTVVAGRQVKEYPAEDEGLQMFQSCLSAGAAYF